MSKFFPKALVTSSLTHQIALAYERHGYTMKEIAEHLDPNCMTVSKAIEREEGKK